MRTLNRIRPALLALGVGLAAALAGGCSDGTTPRLEPTDSIAALPRALSVVEAQVIERSTAFGVELLARSVALDERPNVVLSPLSASMALGMTLNGAGGETFDAMRSTLGFGTMARDEINAAYADLIELLVDLDPAVEFSIGNALWANEGFDMRPSFVERVQASFGARVETADFRLPATLDRINGWAAEATQGRIPEVLDGLDPNLVLILMNAIYFDGAWRESFDASETRPGPFHRADGTTVDVPMMSFKEAPQLPMAAGDDWTAVELPYGGGAYAMVIVVPTGDVGDWVADWSAARWAALRAALTPQKVNRITVPRFTVEHDAFLNPVLTEMGMGVAFRPGADFSELNEDRDLCIDFVRQKTFIEVDEVGTRAAAVTTVGVITFAGGADFDVDRPFLFVLHERLSGTVLFTGVIGDPSLRDGGPATGEGSCG